MRPRTTPLVSVMCGALLAAGAARAQTDASVSDASVAAGDAQSAAAPSCVSDPIPADRLPTVTVTLEPREPRVGDKVLIRYTFRFRAQDRVEFDPDVVAFQQPAIEMDYAREQPERDRTAHPAESGWMTSDVVVAVQPFKVADVRINPMHARVNASDEIARLCTPEVRFRVRSVFGNDPHPAPKDITAPADIHFGALTGRYLALGADAFFLVVVTTLGLTAWMRARPKKVAPPPPPRHPYLVAIEALEQLSRGDMLTRGLTKDYYDAISDILRRYLGGTRNFDAIEMTTREVLARLKDNPLPGVTTVEIERLLSECDLVKFAKYTPSHEECEEVLKGAFSIVERGRPAVMPAMLPSTPSAGAKP